jgi:hypothetical protein
LAVLKNLVPELLPLKKVQLVEKNSVITNFSIALSLEN